MDEDGFKPVKPIWVKKNKTQPKQPNENIQQHKNDTPVGEQEVGTCKDPPNSRDNGQDTWEKKSTITMKTRAHSGHIYKYK